MHPARMSIKARRQTYLKAAIVTGLVITAVLALTVYLPKQNASIRAIATTATTTLPLPTTLQSLMGTGQHAGSQRLGQFIKVDLQLDQALASASAAQLPHILRAHQQLECAGRTTLAAEAPIVRGNATAK